LFTSGVVPVRTSLACAALWVLVLAACSASEKAAETPTVAPWNKVETPQTFRSMSEGEAIEAARVEADDLIGDSPIQETTARLTTYGEALEDLGYGDEDRSSSPPDDTMVWLATLKGIFYEPQGPKPPPSPQEPICAEIVVIFIDPKAYLEGLTGRASEVGFLPAEGCD
jgi:hypothetical protein